MGLPTLIAATVISGIVTAGSQIYSAVQNKSLADYNASVAQANAQSAREWGEYRESREREQQKSRRSQMTVNFLKSGISINSGSPRVVLDEQLVQDEMDALAIRRGGIAEAAGFTTQAEGFRRSGRTAFTSGVISAGATVITTGAQVAGAKLRFT